MKKWLKKILLDSEKVQNGGQNGGTYITQRILPGAKSQSPDPSEILLYPAS